MKTLFTIFFIVIGTLLFSQDTKEFYLKSGDRVSGMITGETDSTYTIETSFGAVTINKADIRPDEVLIYLNSGDKVKGVLILESTEGFKITSQFGELFIERNKVGRVEFINRPTEVSGETKRPGQDDSGRWYYGNEKLNDIYFDPTGYTLEENVLYFSGLSWGYGLTNKFQIMSKWGGYFFGDLNFRPKYMVFKKGNVKSEQAFSIGGHFHLRGFPNKYKLREVVETDIVWETGEEETHTRNDWIRVGEKCNLLEETFTDCEEEEKMWYEFFAAYTVSNLKKSGQGRINHTIGATVTSYSGYDTMPRAYYAVSADARKSLKLIFEVFWDPYWTSLLEFGEQKHVSDIDFDFGFIYAYNESFRIGIHFQRPLVAFYYKF
ncbi:uncharacterized protein METZ01_LOCUS89965 [marine metagenome]|uniref:DUF481 domain-containing protein n=1 Tax=marine metagenome TaxID=408172 RepID=A0A381VAT3_9ZZZZ